MSRLFTADGDYVSFGNRQEIPGLAKLTLAGWVYFTSINDGEIWTKWGSVTSNQSFLIETKTSNSAIGFVLRNSVEALLNRHAYNVIEKNKWMHLALVWSGGSTQSIWKNGVSRSLTDVTVNSVDTIRTSTATERFGQTDNGVASFRGATELWGAWSIALNAGEIGRLASGADPINIRSASLLALPTFDRQGVVYDRKRKVVIKPSGTRPFRDPPRIVSRRVIGLDLGTSPPPPPPGPKLIGGNLTRSNLVDGRLVA